MTDLFRGCTSGDARAYIWGASLLDSSFDFAQDRLGRLSLCQFCLVGILSLSSLWWWWEGHV